ncbi:hypothetical protein HJG53_06715 [Sphingomonas sp. ID1715]|nr:hypothetical protein [Sphingomonas sp. ID1715]NNM76589.1 hypothetical protein [Sphingomonas sp. ID1715]
MAEGEIDGLARPLAPREHPFHRFEDGDERHLVVDRAASPDEAVRHHAGKGRVRPLARAGALDRHHVLVGGEEEGGGAGIGARPGEEQAVASHELMLQRGMDAGVARGEMGAERVKHLGDGGARFGGDGRDPDRCGQALDGGLIDRGRRQRCAELLRAQAHRVDGEDGDEQRHCHRENQQDPLQHSTPVIPASSRDPASLLPQLKASGTPGQARGDALKARQKSTLS